MVVKPLPPNCGGVTDKTAPRPPTVPPAISIARFIPNLVSVSANKLAKEKNHLFLMFNSYVVNIGL
jgi:hypothetical protein